MRRYLVISYSKPEAEFPLTHRQRKLVTELVRSLKAHGPVVTVEAEHDGARMGLLPWMRLARRVRSAEGTVKPAEKSLIVLEEEA